jgi:hypothetical protein
MEALPKNSQSIDWRGEKVRYCRTTFSFEDVNRCVRGLASGRIKTGV